MKTDIHFLSYHGSLLLRMRKVLLKSYTGNQYIHFTFNNIFLIKSCAYELMWKNTAEQGRP